ncbi:MAG TPA: flagellar export protein FliJ [Bacillota bacterium]|mgnify:FL=1|nr:flagellar export protein FliJ [Bacillota bacterium]
MKKFVFPFDSLYRVKQSLKDKLQAEYYAAEAELRKAIEKRDGLLAIRKEETEAYEAIAVHGISPGTIEAYSDFFNELENMISLASKQVDIARRKAEQKRSELAEIYKEVKALEKLRERKYADYLDEQQKAEAVVIQDILSFKVTNAEEHLKQSG